MGLDHLIGVIVDDVEGLAEGLDARMQEAVDRYADPWATDQEEQTPGQFHDALPLIPLPQVPIREPGGGVDEHVVGVRPVSARLGSVDQIPVGEGRAFLVGRRAGGGVPAPLGRAVRAAGDLPAPRRAARRRADRLRRGDVPAAQPPVPAGVRRVRLGRRAWPTSRPTPRPTRTASWSSAWWRRTRDPRAGWAGARLPPPPGHRVRRRREHRGGGRPLRAGPDLPGLVAAGPRAPPGARAPARGGVDHRGWGHAGAPRGRRRRRAARVPRRGRDVAAGRRRGGGVGPGGRGPRPARGGVLRTGPGVVVGAPDGPGDARAPVRRRGHRGRRTVGRGGRASWPRTGSRRPSSCSRRTDRGGPSSRGPARRSTSTRPTSRPASGS